MSACPRGGEHDWIYFPTEREFRCSKCGQRSARAL
jgi:hypothetical protein